MVLSGCTAAAPVRTATTYPIPNNNIGDLPTQAQSSDTRSSDTADSHSDPDPHPAPGSHSDPDSDSSPDPDPDLSADPSHLHPRIAGTVEDSRLTEISGLAHSIAHRDVLYAVNDSGNAPVLYALDGKGKSLASWPLDVANRDWEEMTTLSVANRHFLVIGDTGDNLQAHKVSFLHFLGEPQVPGASQILQPDFTVRFRYEDGPRNVEAFAADGNTLYMLSKEPVTSAGTSPSGIYQLTLPDINNLDPEQVLIARRVGNMPTARRSVIARLAVALAGVDLSHPTAMVFSRNNTDAYILTYEDILHVKRKPGQSWAVALTQPARRLFTHNLKQAEAMALSSSETLWLTSEGTDSPLWSVPTVPPPL